MNQGVVMSNRSKRLKELTPDKRANSAPVVEALAHPAILESGEILCKNGDTREISVTKEADRANPTEDPLLADWMYAQDTCNGTLSVYGALETPEPCVPDAPDSVTARKPTAAEVYRGKKPPQKRDEPKSGACKFPRMKYAQNDPAASVKGGWGK